MNSNQSYFSGLPKLSKSFRSALLDSHHIDLSELLAGVDFVAVRSLFEPWELNENPQVKKMSQKDKARIARALPGRPGNSYNPTKTVRLDRRNGTASLNEVPQAQHSSKPAHSPTAPALTLPSVFSSGGSLADPPINVPDEISTSAQLGGSKRPRADTPVDMAGAISAALARGDVGAAKRIVHSAAARRSAAAAANVTKQVSLVPVAGWDAVGVFHASNGVTIARGDEPCVFHAQGRCTNSENPAACKYSHELGRFPCLHAHLSAADAVRAQLRQGGGEVRPPPQLQAMRPSVAACRNGARCAFSHEALSPLGYACLERDVVQRFRREAVALSEQSAGTEAPTAPPLTRAATATAGT
jgi:hypothetical protein